MADLDFTKEAGEILEHCRTRLDLLPAEAMLACMLAAASIVTCVDDVGAEYTRDRALEDFGKLIDAITSAQHAQRVATAPPAGTA